MAPQMGNRPHIVISHLISAYKSNRFPENRSSTFSAELCPVVPGDGLARVLEHALNWASVASPANYGLPNERMILRIGVGGHGRINVGIDLL